VRPSDATGRPPGSKRGSEIIPPSLVYISANDGSDTRINKEVATLAPVWNVHFVGVDQDGGPNLVAGYAKQCCRITGKRRSPLTWLRMAAAIRRICRSSCPRSLHVVNEDLWLLLRPFLAPAQRVVLDVFDSLFLKRSFPRPLRTMAEQLAYGAPHHIIVTDDARAELMPPIAQTKLIVLENYPYRCDLPVRPWAGGALKIYYGGSMGCARGTRFLRNWLDDDPSVRVVMAGWIADAETQALTQHPRVEFLGTVDQERSMQVAHSCDFILCLYEPSCRNNIYASPNKVYDAIQAGTPVLINQETKISTWVSNQNLGMVLPWCERCDFITLSAEARRFRATFRINPALREKYTWESVAPRLLQAHGLQEQ